MFPKIFDPLTWSIFSSVTAPFKILIVVTALVEIEGETDVPLKSPANWTIPLTVVLASETLPLVI